MSLIPYVEFFRVRLIFAEFATSSKSLKTETAQKRHCNLFSLTALQIAKIGLSERLTHLPIVIFTKIVRRENIPIYGIVMLKNYHSL